MMNERRKIPGRRKGLCFFAAVCLALLLLPACGRAAARTNIWISPTGELTADAVSVMKVDERSYLFLSGNIDPAAWKIGFDADSVTLNGEALRSGETPASAFSTDGPNELTLESGQQKRKVSLTVMRGSPVPSLHIITETGSLKTIHKSKKNKEKGSMVLYGTDGSVAYDGGLKHIKMRGNASTKFKKKNYAVKLETGSSLLGMGKAKRWILIGNYLDKSMIRNQMTFDLARYAGLAYTPDCRQVSLYVNHEYLGLYLLTEKIEIDDDRVDIRNLEEETEKMNDSKPGSYPFAGNPFAQSGHMKGFQIPNEPDDITGGYIIEYDHDVHQYKLASSAYLTKRTMCMIVHSPEYCSEAQIGYVAALMQGFENAIFSKDGKDPDTGKHYSEFVDFDSLVNKYLINEISKNYDSNMSSEYFYKPDDSVSTKAYAGPVWDLDNTYGDYARPEYPDTAKPTKMLTSKKGSLHYWWPELYRQPDFYQALVKRYHETFVPALEILLGRREESETLKSIDSYAAAISDSVAMDYVRYPTLKAKNNKIQTGTNLEENVAYLKNFISERMKYLSGEWKAE